MNKKQFIKFLIFVLIILTISPLSVFAAGLPFTDVPTSAWYYNDVKNAYNDGLINGMTDTTFEPESNVTYAQTVKLASCLHQKYIIGSVILTNGSGDWWDNYVYYAKAFNIIFKDYNWNSYATRAEYAEIFANALPNEALNAKNYINDNSIPDVSMAHPQATAIYKLYRAGILTGMDERGTFRPDSNIKRSEVSAILTRMLNKSVRKNFSLGAGTNENEDEISTVTTYIVNFNSMGGSTVNEQKVKENEKAFWPSDPIREGYRFAGWYVDSNLTKAYNFDNPVTSDITLYTKWIKK